MHNFLLTEIWIFGRQELLDNPVQELHILLAPAISAGEDWLLFEKTKIEQIFIYLN